MAKPLTEFEIMKKHYSELIKLNQRLRYIATGYYIDWDGTIYLQSVVPFLEKVVVIKDPERLETFYGTMIMPNALFEFSKKAKKTKLTISKRDVDIKLGQNDMNELTHTVHIVNPVFDITYAKENVLPKMYKRFFTERENPNFVEYPDYREETDFSDEIVQKLCKAEAVYYQYNATTLTLTKHLFLDIKKEDHLSIQRWGYTPIENETYRVFYLMNHDTSLYTVKTLFSVLQKRGV